MVGAGRTVSEAEKAARWLRERLDPPTLGIVLGSGFSPLAEAVGFENRLAPEAIPGYPRGRADGHGGGVSSAVRCGAGLWLFHGRLHLYEGLTVEEVVFPIAVLAAAGARAVLLTCATGGLGDSDRPGDLVVVADHLNLTGRDPVSGLCGDCGPLHHVDLHDAYDPVFRRSWIHAGSHESVPREGVLACVRGPSYETPAEVRMLRALGADLVCMSTVPEVIAARSLGMRAAAIACIANPGAGLGSEGPIRHADVLETVQRAVRQAGPWMIRGIDAMLDAILSRR